MSDNPKRIDKNLKELVKEVADKTSNDVTAQFVISLVEKISESGSRENSLNNPPKLGYVLEFISSGIEFFRENMFRHLKRKAIEECEKRADPYEIAVVKRALDNGAVFWVEENGEWSVGEAEVKGGYHEMDTYGTYPSIGTAAERFLVFYHDYGVPAKASHQPSDLDEALPF